MRFAFHIQQAKTPQALIH